MLCFNVCVYSWQKVCAKAVQENRIGPGMSQIYVWSRKQNARNRTSTPLASTRAQAIQDLQSDVYVYIYMQNLTGIYTIYIYTYVYVCMCSGATYTICLWVRKNTSAAAPWTVLGFFVLIVCACSRFWIQFQRVWDADQHTGASL